MEYGKIRAALRATSGAKCWGELTAGFFVWLDVRRYSISIGHRAMNRPQERDCCKLSTSRFSRFSGAENRTPLMYKLLPVLILLICPSNFVV